MGVISQAASDQSREQSPQTETESGTDSLDPFLQNFETDRWEMDSDTFHEGITLLSALATARHFIDNAT